MILKTRNKHPWINFVSALSSVLKKSYWAVSLIAISTLSSASTVNAAENISVTFGILEASIRVSSLETFAKDGTISRDLELFLGATSPEEQLQLREALTKPVKVSPVYLSRFFNTDMGERILTQIGSIMNLQSGLNGKLGIRSALVASAFEPEGFTLLGFLQKFPTNIRLRGELILRLSDIVSQVVSATTIVSQTLEELTLAETKSNPPIDFSKLPDLRKEGEFGVQPKQIWILTDASRNRKFYVDVYRPMRSPSKPIAVLILSHGLGSRPEDFDIRAKHWASYGYVVALPQHIGSDFRQIQALRDGLSNQLFDANDFIDRPKDISYVIDELARRNNSEFQGKLNLESVGVAGHSFGAYTAFAVAGAEIDFDNLEKDCGRELLNLNLSLILQCQALTLPRQKYTFRDPRVGAILATNPLGSSIFGKKGLSMIQIPVMTIGGSYDPAAPAVFEQIQAFPWFTTPNKYLALVEGQAHINFSKLDPRIRHTINSLADLTLPSSSLIDNYANGISIAFFGTFSQKEKNFAPYLQSAYAIYLSQGEKFKLSLITSASAERLIE